MIDWREAEGPLPRPPGLWPFGIAAGMLVAAGLIGESNSSGRLAMLVVVGLSLGAAVVSWWGHRRQQAWWRRWRH